MTAYYNEFDPPAAAWLRELIKEGHIAPGDVDERSILHVKPSDLHGYTQCHFFAGVGGWSYALRLASVSDRRPVWTASCPCQPLSCAGLRQGDADERHLWPAFFNLVSECRPAEVIGEQVASGDGREWLAGIRADLEGVGYACGAADLCSAGIGAPNIRQRIYWVANATGRERGERRESQAQDRQLSEPAGCEGKREPEHTGIEGPRRMVACGPSAGGFWSGSRTIECRDGKRQEDSGARGLGHALGIGGQAPRVSASPGEEICREEGKAARARGVLLPGFWSRSQSIRCRDGRNRRIPVESGLFPLAARIPGRVALLRGAGNAINAELAATFIRWALTG